MAKAQQNKSTSKPNIPMEKAEKMGTGNIIILGVSLIVAAFLLGYLLFALWPQAQPDATGKIPDSTLALFGFSTTISPEVRLLLLVMVVGLIGSYIHTTVSFVNSAGNRRLVKSWVWYYAARPFAGAFLALIFYLVLRGGLLSAGVGTEDINQYGILAFGGLAGLFSSQALEKLGDIFGSPFRERQADKLGDKMSDSKPK